jgi:hypothetical protein
VYENNPQTIGELKAAIIAQIREIPWEESRESFAVWGVAPILPEPVYLDLYLCVVPMMPKASSVLPNDSHTFLLWDFPDLCCDCCLQFTNCLRIVLIHIILEIPPQPFGAHFGKNIEIICKLTQMAKTLWKDHP